MHILCILCGCEYWYITIIEYIFVELPALGYTTWEIWKELVHNAAVYQMLMKEL